MKRVFGVLTIVSIFLIFFCQLSLSEQEKPAKASKTEEQGSAGGVRTGPVIEFETKVQDLGEIAPSSNTLCEFKFTNAGTEELVIKDVKRTCGCTVIKLSKKNYAPGESGAIKVRYSASSLPSTIQKSVYAYTNDPGNQKIKLVIKAEVVSKVEHEPKALDLLLKGENSNSPEITLTSKDNKKFTIKRIRSTGDTIDFAYDPSQESDKFVLKGKVDIEKLKKIKQGRVYIYLSHPECKQVMIPYKVLAEYKLQPPGLALLQVEPGEVIKRELWVLSNYNEAFEIESITSAEGYVKCANAKEVLNPETKKPRYNLELEITPPESSKAKKLFRDTVQVKIKDGDTFEVPCFGLYPKK